MAAAEVRDAHRTDAPGRTRDQRLLGSRTADQYAGEEHQHAADYDLEGRREERRVHVAEPDVGNGGELERDDDDRHECGYGEAWDQVGQSVADGAKKSHQPADRAAQKGLA